MVAFVWRSAISRTQWTGGKVTSLLPLLLLVLLAGYTWKATTSFSEIRTFEKAVDTSEQRVRHYDFIISKKLMAPDGVEKELTVVNGMFPGPTIHANKGDVVEVFVHNGLDSVKESTSLHWHGIKQLGSNVMDGAPGLTQCGIPPGHNFTYRFTVDDGGTYWWHSHSHLQRLDGVFGALIVNDESDASYNQKLGHYDEEIVIMLHDHYFDKSSQILKTYLSRIGRGMEPVPDSGLINGKGSFDCSRLLHDRHKCTMSTSELEEFQFRPGKKYRLRIINAASMATYAFGVDEHPLKVIEADSTEVEPVMFNYLPIAPGQRYSVIVEADSNRDSVFMRAIMNPECFNYKNLHLDFTTKAIVRYRRSPIDDLIRLTRRMLGRTQKLPKSKAWNEDPNPTICMDLNPSTLSPVKIEQVPDPDIQVQLWAKIIALDMRDSAPFSFFNRTSFQPALGAPNLFVELGLANVSESVKVERVIGHEVVDSKWGGEQMVVDIPHGAVVELIINNGDEMPHPFHLHGHDFWVVHTHQPDNLFGHWRHDKEYNYTLDNAVRRDTVSVPRFGHAVLRFRANNPGIWAFHCHILWHLATGMMMQFASGMDAFTEQISHQMVEFCDTERRLGPLMVQSLPGWHP